MYLTDGASGRILSGRLAGVQVGCSAAANLGQLGTVIIALGYQPYC